MLAAVFNTIEQLSEVTSCIGCGDIGHVIRLSDSLSDGKPSATPIIGYAPIASATENRPNRGTSRIAVGRCGRHAVWRDTLRR
jgi:hypothetical protein